jgi:uncharacterized protein
MALQLDEPTGGNLITRVEAGCVWVNGRAWTSPVIVPWQGEVRAWHVDSFEALQASHFEALLADAPELVLFGSGARLRFAHPRLQQALHAARIGIDTMDLGAACRTYAVLTSEGRRVTAALLPV